MFGQVLGCPDAASCYLPPAGSECIGTNNLDLQCPNSKQHHLLSQNIYANHFLCKSHIIVHTRIRNYNEKSGQSSTILHFTSVLTLITHMLKITGVITKNAD